MAEISMLPVTRCYASALLSLSLEGRVVASVEKQLTILSRLLEENKEFERFIVGSIASLSEKFSVIDFLVEKVFDSGKKATFLVGSWLRVLAENGRLCLLPSVLSTFRDLLAQERGEIIIFIISAHCLSDNMLVTLKRVFSSSLGKKVLLQVSIDSSLLGGLIVRAGSYQIDGSLRKKLSLLSCALKEVG